MHTIAVVPTRMDRGRLRSGSLTSPPANDTSPNPSYAHNTDTSPSPRLPIVTGPAAVAVRFETSAPWLLPRTNDAPAISASAENLATDDRPTMVAPSFTPLMLTVAAKRMAIADSDRAARTWLSGSIPNARRE